MPLNLELKARLKNPISALVTAKKNAQYVGILNQSDFYYRVEIGRLKLRVFSKKCGELIYYNREEVKNDRWSRYQIYRVNSPIYLRKFLDFSFTPIAVVRKTRKLFLYKNARIHIDLVERLGSFIEFEVLVEKGNQQAKELLHELSRMFLIKKNQTVRKSYIDLLRTAKNK
jgi:predicted adenylyl cyclase CyaB